MTQPFRLAEGGRIDRAKPLAFSFNGRDYRGYTGDTLASALLANGVHFVGRSFKYHRPRGIMSAGPEECNALVQVGEDPRTDPNTKATQLELVEGLRSMPQNCWPSLDVDIGAANSLIARFIPSGFYYKTFMWPASFWMRYEHFIRHSAGLGKSPTARDPDSYDKSYAHCDVLVVGAGPAGLAAALAAGRAGARVILAEADFEAGGSLLGQSGETINERPALDWVAETLDELRQMPEVRVMTRTVCYGYHDHNFLTLMENVSDHLTEKPDAGPRHRLWKLRAGQVVLATGAIERPLVFPDNDRPGIMTANAARSYVNRFAVRPGSRAVIFTNNDSAYAAALDLEAAGVEIGAVVDLREDPSGPFTERAEERGISVLPSRSVVATKGGKRISAVQVGDIDVTGTRIVGAPQEIACDLLLTSGGWNPTVHLFTQAGGKLSWDEAHACYVPGEAMQKGQYSVGASGGRFGLQGCLEEGYQAGVAAAAAQRMKTRSRKKIVFEASDDDFLPGRWMWLPPTPQPAGRGGKQFVDLQNDSTAADLKLALREGYRSIEHVKRYTTTGMATDQGKTANVNALGIVAETVERPLPEVGVTTFRPPFFPVTFGIFAGRDVDDLLDPIRKTPMHGWHESNGALFEDVGQWRRPWYYPREGEDMHAAVAREVKSCRASLGILDASTLGKIDIQGADAAEFLNRVYTNAWSKLAVGRCRYGLMLGEDGMVMDDGVTARLSEHHFVMTTTTGNAAPVLAHLEEYLQTEWPELDVFLTSVTEQFATITLSGPNARHLLAEMTDLDLSPDALPHMGITIGEVAGVPARVFRISFTGEQSFEINVPASYGLFIWQALMTAGQSYDITPYGTEAMHVLRAEKGFIIVGQETDGSVTPLDLGMDWIVSKTKDFVGKRSLTRPDMLDPERKQLVGLLTDDPNEVLPEGAQLVERVLDRPPMPMLGHVTSSYMSPNCERSIAMALIKGGHARKGQKVHAPLADGRVVTCTIAEGPVFFDPEGERLNG
jgi:sarcosine oxidase subunit alpha